MRVGTDTIKARLGILVRIRSLCPISRMSATRSYCWQAITYDGDCMNSSSMALSSIRFRHNHLQRARQDRERHRRVARVLAIQLKRRRTGCTADEPLRLKIFHIAKVDVRAAQNTLSVAQHVQIATVLEDTNIQQPIVHPRLRKKRKRP